MTEDERCSILLEAKAQPDGIIFAIMTLGMSDEDRRRLQNIRLLADDGYLAQMNNSAYRITAKGEALLRETTAIQMAAGPVTLRRLFKAHGGKVWTAVLAALAALRSCG